MIYRHRLRLLLLAVVIIGGCLVLFYRLWFLQIENQEHYIRRQPVTDTARQRVPSVRGRIVDRNGIEFARNETSMEVGLNLAAVEAAWNEKNRALPKKQRREIPSFTYGPKEQKVTDIIALLNELVFPELDRLKLYRVPASDLEKEKQKRAIITSYISNKGVIPYTYEKNLLQADEESFKRFTAYAENAPNIPGLTVSQRPKRRYPLKAMAGHLIGYIRENRDVLPPDEVKAMEQAKQKWDFIEADDFGVAGLEQSLEEKLRGKPGERIWLKNEHGRLTDEIEELRRDPLPGADVFLTLDARIQMIAEMALREAVDENGHRVGRAAAVVMDPNTGEILAMASVPSYDPSIFIPPQDPAMIKAVFEDPMGAALPVALRADAPGSTFKLLTAIAGSMAGKGGSYNCPGFIDYGRPIACWIYRQKKGSHGTLDLANGIKNSCNCYFFRMGNEAGIDRINEAAGFFGFGTPDAPGHSGVELPSGVEANGYVGSKAWWAAQGRGPWTPSETAYISIGQGTMAATPLQICMIGAAIASGGKVYQPTLVHHSEEWQYDRDGQRKKIITDFTKKLRADLLQHGVRKRDIENMREGMRRVVNDKGGTGKNAMSTMCVIAGKTGTAQKDRWDPVTKKKIVDNRTLFMAFAPYEAPKLAVSIMVLNGESGGKTAAPIAKRIIEQTLAMWAGNYNPGVQPLEPAAGNFDKIDQIVYPGDSVPPPPEPGEEGEEAPGEETGEDHEPAAPVVVKPAAPAPKAEVVVEEDDSKTLTRQILKPVQFRRKTDPPNPPPVLPVKTAQVPR